MLKGIATAAVPTIRVSDRATLGTTPTVLGIVCNTDSEC